VADDVEKESKLTAKQEAFVNYYIETGNATEAYKKAGYKVKSEKAAGACAARLLGNARIKAAIAAKMKEREKPSIAKADEVLAFFTSVLRGEVKDEQIVVLGTGEGRSQAVRMETRVSTKDRVKAGEQLLKRYPAELDKAEQKARIAKLEASLKAMEDEQAAANDDVVIVDDWMCENGNEDTSS
jgi:phage terminase small subunit